MLNHKKILLFDFETTGLSPKTDEIIEIGALLLSKTESGEYHVEAEMDELVKSVSIVPPNITAITHITTEELNSKGIHPNIAFEMLYSLYSEDTLLIAYNISFDLGFLASFFEKNGLRNFQIKNDILDVMAIYRDRHYYPHKLSSAVEKYQVNIQNTHRAIDDIKATLEVLKSMAKEQDNIDDYVNTIGYNAKYGVPRLPRHVSCVPQRGGQREIEAKKKTHRE